MIFLNVGQFSRDTLLLKFLTKCYHRASKRTISKTTTMYIYNYSLNVLPIVLKS